MSTHSPPAKYRPLLTAAQIGHIIHLCKSDLSNLSVGVISVLAPFQFKIAHSSVTPAYTPTKIDSLEAFDTLSDTTTTESKSETLASKLLTYQTHGPSSLTLRELESVQEYRFINGLMTSEESTTYQNKLLGI